MDGCGCISAMADVTQEVEELRVRNSTFGDCSFLADHITPPETIAGMAHLEELYGLAEVFAARPEQKLIFVSNNHFLAKQAALAARSLRRYLRPGQDGREEAEPDGWDDIFDEDDFFAEDQGRRTYAETRFPGICEDSAILLSHPEITVLIDGKKLGKGLGAAGESAELSVQGQLKTTQEAVLFEQAGSALVLLDEQIQQSEEFLLKLPMLENSDTYLSVLRGQKNEQFLKRLCFEFGFLVVEIGTPLKKHYENVLLQAVRNEVLALEKGLSASRLIATLMNYRKEDFTEADIGIWVVRARDKHRLRKDSLFLDAGDFQLYNGASGKSGVECLDEMIGLSRLKESVKRTVAVQMAEAAGLCGDRKSKRCLNICFAGRPGVGKTKVAEIYARILGENGITNGKFYYASRDKFVGKYLGQTAPKIAELFEAGRGGVIFVDEAGCLLNDDNFTKEAITEFVRHMENERDTCVIFATYPEEMKKLLETDPGFSSRIAKVITFDEYSPEELWEIFLLMASRKSIEVAPDCRNIVMNHMCALKKKKRENFGNAREVRKLLELSYEFMCLRLGKKMTADDIAAAAAETGIVLAGRPRIGFACPEGEEG